MFEDIVENTDRFFQVMIVLGITPLMWFDPVIINAERC
jgi:hypothetical protein